MTSSLTKSGNKQSANAIVDQAPASTNALKKIAIVGATGYTGQELLRLLLQHDNVAIHSAVSHSKSGADFASIYPSFHKVTNLICREADVDLEQLATEVDLIFLALPHGHAATKVTKSILQNCKVIDLSADFRLKNAADYQSWYNFEHPHPELLEQAVYGLPEINRQLIVDAQLVANPGCYATCSILSLAPLIAAQLVNNDSIIIDAKSGISGAGRAPEQDTHFNECNESIKAYKIASHRHTPEIEAQLGAISTSRFCTSFTPHLVPMNRGILTTAYASLKKNSVSRADLEQIYRDFYQNEPFVRIFSASDPHYNFPETRWVKGSNFCDIGLAVDPRTNRVIVIGAIDNLIKGAAGQAIQNMNLLFNWPELTGLRQSPLFPA